MEVATLNTLSYAIQNVKLGTPVKSADPSSISKVRLIVRVRSFLPQEIVAKEGNPKSCVSVLDQNLGSSSEVSVHIKDPDTSRNESYQLDSFFGQEDDNISHIFYREVNPLIPGVFHGCNATVFAYGATGSGKTYTMQGTDEHPGLMPRTMSTVLSMCKMTGSTAEISYYEVYMDRCYDLLEVKAKEIAILDDKDGQIHLKGLSRVPVQSMSEFNEVLSCGVQRRKVAHTGLNDVSSRSHGVLVIIVSTPCSHDSGAVVTGKMNLIDLAGNEDNRRTCNEGIRLQESAKINQSLFALSNVIYALNNNKPRIPYRESKLTRILQDSLGGTNRALMVACLNPGKYQESVYTVSLAARSRQISNYISSSQKVATPTVKVTMEAKLQAWLESKGKSKSAQRGRAFGSPFPGKTPSSVSPVKKSNCNNPAKAKPRCNAKLRSICLPSSNLFNNEITVASKLEDLPLAAGSNGEEVNADTTGLLFESPTYLQEEPLNKQGKMKSTNSVIFVGSPPINGSENELESPSREALSPINLNINQETPKTPSFATCANDPHMICTPFDKYNAWSSNLKSSVIQQYIHFLNTASREELLEIKGIGLKMAEYILELRETSPLRSLSDLEKIGLSSKQVHNMFSRAAKGIF